MSALAPAAQVSVGQIYRLFASKEDIIRALVRDDAEHHLADLRHIVDRARQGELSVHDSLIETARLAMSESDEALSFEILAEAHRNDAVSAVIAEMCLGFRALFRDLACMANPALTSSDLDGFEEIMLAIMFGLGHRQLSGSCLSAEETAQRTARAIMVALNAAA